MAKFSALHLFALAAFVCSSLECICAGFSIDYDNNTFLMDGQPFRYVSGSVHYFRMPRQYWRDRLRKMRAAGLNAVSTYVEWSQHEPEPGHYDFSGGLNITEFLRIAQEEDLYVLLRPGPYICAERDMGGLPFWLLKQHPDIHLRSSDARYTEHVEKWLDKLMPIFEPHLYGNGGPIILVQVENEYGSYGACDTTYKTWLRDLFKRHVQDKAVLFTTDGPYVLKCGKIPGVYATIDFGPGVNVTASFNSMRKYEPKGPLVNSEFYTGWLTHWGKPVGRQNTQVLLSTLTEMLDLGANVNFYMFYGGTNFGFTAGANGNSHMYESDITSYDYDAPITEAGDLTDEYFGIKNIVTKYLPAANISVTISEKADYGAVQLKAVASLLSPNIRSALGRFYQAEHPQSFEVVGQNFGYLLYETEIPFNSTKPQVLYIPKLHDYGIVFLNGLFQNTLSRELKSNKLTVPPAQIGDKLSILVENLGRINYGNHNNDSKGILSHVFYGDQVLKSWNMTSFELKDLKPVREIFIKNPEFEFHEHSNLTFFVGRFAVDANNLTEGYPSDTFIDVSALKKGFIFVNGFNLGRYWTKRGPQKTLYLPGAFLKPHPRKNIVIVMDEALKEAPVIKFSKIPIFS